MSNEVHEALVKLAKKESLPLVRSRSNAETESAYLRYWRSNGNITVQKQKGKDILYINGKRILRKPEISKIGAKEYDRMNGSGARKLVYSLKHRFVGLSQHNIQDNELYQSFS